jgi:integrase
MPQNYDIMASTVRHFAEPRRKVEKMPQVRIQYVHNYVDRHGKNWRSYFNPPGGPKVALTARPIGSPEWLAQLHAARHGETVIPGVGAKGSPKGSVNFVIASWLASNEYRGLKARSRRAYDAPFEFLRQKIGPFLVADIRRGQIKELLKQTENDGAYNSLLLATRKIMTEAIELELRDEDPTVKIKKRVSKNPFGRRCWRLEHIEQYRRRHPIGTVARTALEIGFNTGMRIGDAAMFGRQHLIEGGKAFSNVPVKTEKFGTIVAQPIRDPQLIAALAAAPVRGQRPFLCNPSGDNYTVDYLGDHFAEWCKEAGLPDFCRFHGLRKACAVRMSHAGCSKHEIMAWIGDKDPKMVELYCKERDTWLLSESGADKVDAMMAARAL